MKEFRDVFYSEALRLVGEGKKVRFQFSDFYSEALHLVGEGKKVRFQFFDHDRWYILDRTTPLTVDQLISIRFQEIIEYEPAKLEIVAYPTMGKKTSRHCFHSMTPDVSVYIRGPGFASCSAVRVVITEIKNGK
jgi:hypothetical protein